MIRFLSIPFRFTLEVFVLHTITSFGATENSNIYE